MTNRYFGTMGSARVALAFALAVGSVAPALAQQAETPAPSSTRPIDFRLPPAPENDGRTPGVQGPSDNGLAPVGPGERRGATPTPTPVPSPPPPRVTPTQPVTTAPVQSQPRSESGAARQAPRSETATPPDSPADAATETVAEPAPLPAAPSLAADTETVPADDAPIAPATPADESGTPIWAWLLAVLAAAGAGFWYWRRRPALAGNAPAAPVPAAAVPPPAPRPLPKASAPQPAAPQPAPPKPAPVPARPTRLPEIAGVAAGQRAPSPLVTRPAAERRALVSIALEVTSIRMTPEHVAVGFTLNIANQGSADATGLMVRIALNQGSAMPESVLARFFDGAGGSVLRDDMVIRTGAGEALTTEAMLPRAIIEPLMIGGKPMLVPVMAFDVTYHWESDDPDAFGQVAGSFVLGRESGASDSDKLTPLPLDRISYAVDRPGARATAMRRSQ